MLRELVSVAPQMLRATYEAWGYSPSYIRLEQLWLEAYGGMVGGATQLYAQGGVESARAEGLAMATQLYSLLQGRMQYRGAPAAFRNRRERCHERARHIGPAARLYGSSLSASPQTHGTLPSVAARADVHQPSAN